MTSKRPSTLAGIADRFQLHRAPIVIGGCGRSGTTLLLAMLGGHPRIHTIPDETHTFCPTAYGQQDLVPSEASVTGAAGRDQLHQLRMSRFNPKAGFAWDRLVDALVRHPPPPSSVRWCEKTPKNVLFFPRILEELDEVRIIHVVRDGRDVITSVHPDRDGGFHVPPMRWIEEVEAGLSVAGDIRVMTVRYEDLVLDYENSMRRILQFLEEPYDARLINWHRHSNVQQHDSWEGLKVRALYSSAIGRWRRKEYAPVVEALMADPRAVALLERVGYDRR